MKKAKGTKPQYYEVQAMTDGGDDDMKLTMAKYKAQANYPSGGTSFRQNTAYQGLLNNKWFDLNNGFSSDGTGQVSIAEAIRLCQLAYFNHGVIGHVIDVMQEFTINKLDFLCNKKSPKEIMFGWSEAVGLKTFLDQVALEYYRSGNVFIYRFENTLKASKIKDLNKAFSNIFIDGSSKIPIKYTLINPTLVRLVDSGLIHAKQYLVVIPASEANLLLKAFESQPDMFNDMPPEFKTAVESFMGTDKKTRRSSSDLTIRLNPDNVIALHRKKQPYERYAVPFLARALDDIMFKKELRNMDRALARVIGRILIHVKVGNNELIPSPAALQALTDKLNYSSVSTYLVTDGTVEINQYYPNVGEMLDGKKYNAINQDIFWALGINPAAFGDGSGSFSNNFLGIKILIERIKDGRDKILRDFLIPECKRVSTAFNLKSEVIPEIIGADLNDSNESAKVYARLYELGVISPQSMIENVREGRVPTYEEEIDRQKEAEQLRSEGLFLPILNRGGNSPNSGRPTGGENAPQSKMKKTVPVGAVSIRAFGQEEYDKCYKEICGIVKDNLKVKKLDDKQKEILAKMCRDFLVTTPYSEESLKEYLNKFGQDNKV